MCTLKRPSSIENSDDLSLIATWKTNYRQLPPVNSSCLGNGPEKSFIRPHDDVNSNSRKGKLQLKEWLSYPSAPSERAENTCGGFM